MARKTKQGKKLGKSGTSKGVRRVLSPGQSAYRKRLERMRQAGFKSERDYRRALTTKAVKGVLKHLGAIRGQGRYDMVGMAAGRREAPRAEAPRRAFFKDLAINIRTSGGSVAGGFRAIGSPRRRKK